MLYSSHAVIYTLVILFYVVFSSLLVFYVICPCLCNVPVQPASKVVCFVMQYCAVI